MPISKCLEFFFGRKWLHLKISERCSWRTKERVEILDTSRHVICMYDRAARTPRRASRTPGLKRLKARTYVDIDTEFRIKLSDVKILVQDMAWGREFRRNSSLQAACDQWSLRKISGMDPGIVAPGCLVNRRYPKLGGHRSHAARVRRQYASTQRCALDSFNIHINSNNLERFHDFTVFYARGYY